MLVYGWLTRRSIDFINGWDRGVLQKAVDNCHCNAYGDVSRSSSTCPSRFLWCILTKPTCCVEQGIFHMNQGQNCRITKSIDEQSTSISKIWVIFFRKCSWCYALIATGTLPKLPGNNPVQPAGQRAIVFPDSTNPRLIAPVYAYTGDTPTQVGSVIPGSGNSPTTAAAPTSSSVSLPTSTSSVSKPSPFTSIPSAPESTAPPSVPHQPVSSYFPHSSVSSAPHQVVSSSHGTSSSVIPVPHTSTATQPTATQVDDEPCDPEPTSHGMHVPSTTSYAQPTETQEDGDDDDDDDDEPCDSEPTSTHNVHIPSSTSFVQPTEVQSNNDEPCYSEPASNSASVPSTTSYAHTIPATTIKHPFPSVPSISIPSVAIPTLSMPPMPGAGSPANGGNDGNVHTGVGSGSNSDVGSGSGSSVPHYNNNPGVHIPMPAFVPNGHGVINNNNPATNSDGPIVPGSSNTGKPRRCPSRRTKRSILAEKSNAPVPVKGVRNATPVSSSLRLHHVHYSRRRFGMNFDRD